MAIRIPFSAAALRTNSPSISHLMQAGLDNPGIVSLAAGFVDQQSPPGARRLGAALAACRNPVA